ncbi:hypothetical protein D3Z39_10950 [Anaerotruncus colihominis]|uniref:Uncharacterized protein n=1 Tax=Anaerotruncus colihominis TaxID=169435 RepID=A0A845RH73_9FIRM|nr:hypothetical protein [Anaerotruncus colihominis]NBI79370.1 hypothetical protein [Anaerotruncus colihominis]
MWTGPFFQDAPWFHCTTDKTFFTLRRTFCLRRSRLKFFAEAFFQKGWKVFRRSLFSKRLESFSPKPFFKKAGKFFAEAFFQKGWKVFRRSLFFKKAGKFFAEAFFQKGWKAGMAQAFLER